MFDFAADARNEGGEAGQNHKGLVTFDRKYKKDAFYAYKAWLSDEPFVHICGKRYVDRVEAVTKVTVYSNQTKVALYANGELVAEKEAPDHFFHFYAPNIGYTELVAVAGDCRDESYINKVEVFNEAYRLKEKNAILNWFDITAPEGYFSLNDKIGDIMSTTRGKLLIMSWATRLLSQVEKGEGKGKGAACFELNGDILKMLSSFTVLRLSGMVTMANIHLTKEDLLSLNAQLNTIKKK
jgi:beta-galactosidase